MSSVRRLQRLQLPIDPLARAGLVACVVLWLLLCVVAPARADFGTGDPPTVVEHLYLWKLTLTTDQDDPPGVPWDTDTEILVKIYTYHDGHEAIFWQVFNDIDMDAPNDTSFTVVDGDGLAPERIALRLPAFAHGECDPLDPVTYRIDVWELDKNEAGHLVGEIGKAALAAGIVAPQAMGWGLAAQLADSVINHVCNDETLLGTDGGWFPSADTLIGPIEVSKHYRYALKWTVDTLDHSVCRTGSMSAIVPGILQDVPDIDPSAVKLWEAVAKGYDPEHPLTKESAEALQRWLALLKALELVDSVTTEPGTDVGWRSELVNPGAAFYASASLAIAPSGQLFAAGGDVTPRLSRQEGACWIPEDVEPSAYGGISAFGDRVATDGAGRPRMVYLSDLFTGQAELRHAEWTGSSWSISPVDTMDWSYSEYPTISLAVDGLDRSHVTYAKPDPSDFYRKAFTHAVQGSSGWERDTIETVGNVGATHDLSLDGDDIPHVVYSVRSSGSIFRVPQIRYARRIAGAWSKDSLDATQFTLPSWPCALALDGTGVPHVTYTRSTPAGIEIVYSRKDIAGWNREIVRTVPHTGQWHRSTSMAVGADGEVHIAAVSDLDMERVLYLRRDGGAWRETVLDSNRVYLGTHPDLKIDPAGRLHFAHDRMHEFIAYSGLFEVVIAHTYEQTPGGGAIGRTGSSPGAADFGPARDGRNVRQASYVDASACSWRTRVKDLIVRMGREPLAVELQEAQAAGADPWLIAQAQTALAAGDSLRTLPDHSAALESYREGFSLLLEGNHPEFVVGVQPGERRLGGLRVRMAGPNPASSRVQLRLQVPTNERVRVRVFDVAGRLVATLADGSFKAGEYPLTWSPNNGAGREQRQGLYFVRAEGPSGRDVARVVVIGGR
jgi:hypothetical protein